MEHIRPRFTDEEARDLASGHWGVSGQISPLPSYLGQNFRIANDPQPGHILKIAPGNEVEQDLDIWTYKAFVRQPALAKGDGPIAAYRKWAQQFYPPG